MTQLPATPGPRLSEQPRIDGVQDGVVNGFVFDYSVPLGDQVANTGQFVTQAGEDADRNGDRQVLTQAKIAQSVYVRAVIGVPGQHDLPGFSGCSVMHCKQFGPCGYDCFDLLVSFLGATADTVTGSSSSAGWFSTSETSSVGIVSVCGSSKKKGCSGSTGTSGCRKTS